MVRLKKDTVVEDHPTSLFRVRIDLVEQANPAEIVSYIQRYCDKRQFQVLRSTAGIHKICDRGVPHIHYHAEINTDRCPKMFKSGERYNFRKDIQISKPSWFSPSTNAISCVVEKPKIHELMEVEECILKCLRYSLKERLPIHIGCVGFSTDEITSMTKFAYDEFQETLRQKREADLKLEEDRLKWSVVCRELDFKAPRSYRQTLLHLMRFGDKWVDYQKVNQDRLHNIARNYCRKVKIYGEETDIILCENPSHLMLFNREQEKKPYMTKMRRDARDFAENLKENLILG